MTLESLLKDPLLWLGIVGYVYSSIIQSLPEPELNSSKKYLFIYKLLHQLGANWSQVAQAKNIQEIQKGLGK